MSRAPALLALIAAALVATGAGTIESRTPSGRTPLVLPPVSRDAPLPDGYGDLVRRIGQRGPADTLGDGLYARAEAAFRAGDFDVATKRYQEFTQKFIRNLRMNGALERILLIRGGRDFDDEPLRLYARAEALRAEEEPDSAALLLRKGLERYPGAALRYHFRMALAEIARDRGDHAAALEQAIAVADSSVKSRLSPYALKMAGDETLAMGGPPQRAMGYYQALLERYPDSPLVAGVRAQVLAMRKRMQL